MSNSYFQQHISGTDNCHASSNQQKSNSAIELRFDNLLSLSPFDPPASTTTSVIPQSSWGRVVPPPVVSTFNDRQSTSWLPSVTSYSSTINNVQPSSSLPSDFIVHSHHQSPNHRSFCIDSLKASANNSTTTTKLQHFGGDSTGLNSQSRNNVRRSSKRPAEKPSLPQSEPTINDTANSVPCNTDPYHSYYNYCLPNSTDVDLSSNIFDFDTPSSSLISENDPLWPSRPVTHTTAPTHVWSSSTTVGYQPYQFDANSRTHPQPSTSNNQQQRLLRIDKNPLTAGFHIANMLPEISATSMITDSDG
jgi:hypothetical protein